MCLTFELFLFFCFELMEQGKANFLSKRNGEGFCSGVYFFRLGKLAASRLFFHDFIMIKVLLKPK